MKQIMEVPSLLEEGSSSVKRKPDYRAHQGRCCSSWVTLLKSGRK